MSGQNINFTGATFSGGFSVGDYSTTVSNVNLNQVHTGNGDNVSGNVSINQVSVSQTGLSNVKIRGEKATVKVSNTVGTNPKKTILIKNENGDICSMVTGLQSGTIEIQDGETTTTFSFD